MGFKKGVPRDLRAHRVDRPRDANANNTSTDNPPQAGPSNTPGGTAPPPTTTTQPANSQPQPPSVPASAPAPLLNLTWPTAQRLPRAQPENPTSPRQARVPLVRSTVPGETPYGGTTQTRSTREESPEQLHYRADIQRIPGTNSDRQIIREVTAEDVAADTLRGLPNGQAQRRLPTPPLSE